MLRRDLVLLLVLDGRLFCQRPNPPRRILFWCDRLKQDVQVLTGQFVNVTKQPVQKITPPDRIFGFLCSYRSSLIPSTLSSLRFKLTTSWGVFVHGLPELLVHLVASVRQVLCSYQIPQILIIS